MADSTDLSLGTFDLLGQFTGGGIATPPATPGAQLVPYQAQSAGGGATSVYDDLTGTASTILHSFTNGIATVFSGVAKNYAAYLGGSGQQVGTDRYGQPIYQVIDPNTGATYTTSSAAWPGAPGSPSNYPERTPPNYAQGGVFGWLTNLLSLPSPTPVAGLGVVPVGAGAAPGLAGTSIAGVSVPQIALVAGVALVAYFAIRAVAR